MIATSEVKNLERTRDLQQEVGAMLDRFHTGGLPARFIMEVLSSESEIWLARVNREELAEAERREQGAQMSARERIG